jgi:type II secretory pathway component PulF
MSEAYRYKGLRLDGRLVEGRITASSEQDAVAQLTSQRIQAFEVQPDTANRRRFARRKASPRDRVRVLRQLSMLVRAGAPLLTCFDSLLEDEPCLEIHDRLKAVRSDLRGGGRLSLAFSRHFVDLPDYAPRLVELGEATGSLAERLAEVSGQMERDLAAAEELRNALAYPAFLAFAGLGAVLFIFMVVVPRFSALLSDARGEIPLVSRIVLNIGQTVSEHSILVLVGLGLTVLAGVRLASMASTREALIRIAFRTPIIGRFLDASDTARWARVTGTALAAGASLLDALTLAERGVISISRREGLAEVRRAVRSGDPVEAALRAHTDMDAMTLNLIRTGRLSGAMADMLLFVAESGEQQARNLSKRLTSLAEPLAIAFIASIIGLVVVSLVLAMSSLYSFDIN